MKRLLRSYTSVTRTERIGIAVLAVVIIILVGVRLTMHYWVHPANNAEEQKRLTKAWEVYKRSQPVVATTTSTDTAADDYQDAYDDNETPLPDIININTADSATLVRLKGIGPATAKRIVDRRKRKGPFTKVDQLLEVSSMPDATFEVLKKHLTVE